jgi:hypothetical protein
MLKRKVLLTALLSAMFGHNCMAQYSDRKIVTPGYVIAYKDFSITVPKTGGALQKGVWSFEKNTIEEVVMFSRPDTPEFMLRNRLSGGSLSWLVTVTFRKPRTAVSASDYMDKWAPGLAFKSYPTSNKSNSCVEIELLDDKKMGKDGFFLTSLLCYHASTDQIIDLSVSELNTPSRPPDEYFIKVVANLFGSFKLK